MKLSMTCEKWNEMENEMAFVCSHFSLSFLLSTFLYDLKWRDELVACLEVSDMPTYNGYRTT